MTLTLACVTQRLVVPNSVSLSILFLTRVVPVDLICSASSDFTVGVEGWPGTSQKYGDFRLSVVDVRWDYPRRDAERRRNSASLMK